MHPEAADKAFRYFISRINGGLFGRSWARKPHRGLQWARGQEFHKDGRLHFHAVISAPGNDIWNLTRISTWHRLWLHEFGFNRLERPTSQEAVARYVAKYVSKGGVIDFSRNFGAWVPCAPDFKQAVVVGELPGLAPASSPVPTAEAPST